MRAWGDVEDWNFLHDAELTRYRSREAVRMWIAFIVLVTGWLFFAVLAFSMTKIERERDIRELKLRRDLSTVTAVCRR